MGLQVDENMGRAVGRDAVRDQKFWFRKDIAPPQGGCGGLDECYAVEEMTAEEIFLGKVTFAQIGNAWSRKPAEGVSSVALLTLVSVSCLLTC